MRIEAITEQSKKRAEKIAEENGGILIPVYSVVKADEQGRVQSITHDHLKELTHIEK